jgi:hypothetical protein
VNCRLFQRDLQEPEIREQQNLLQYPFNKPRFVNLFSRQNAARKAVYPDISRGIARWRDPNLCAYERESRCVQQLAHERHLELTGQKDSLTKDFAKFFLILVVVFSEFRRNGEKLEILRLHPGVDARS